MLSIVIIAAGSKVVGFFLIAPLIGPLLFLMRATWARERVR
jgi:hypothetical protein